MTNTDPMPELTNQYERFQETGDKYPMIVDVVDGTQRTLMDEALNVYQRSDIWSITWADLRSPIREYMDTSELVNRQTANDEIYTLYMQVLMQLNPQLRSVTSATEMMVEMEKIPGLPECQGSYTQSEYETTDGKHRVMTYTQVDLGDSVSMFVDLYDDNAERVKSYGVGMHLVDGQSVMVWGGAGVANERSPEETEMLLAIPAAQANNLARVMSGRVHPYQKDFKLIEIQEESAKESDIDELELHVIIAYARMQYEVAYATNLAEFADGNGVLQMVDLCEMRDIVAERIRQLATRV
jgi:hypothetical protein